MKLDVISGFLGAGKTTLIQHLMRTLYKNEKILIIENEFGEVGLDSAILRAKGYTLKELNAGCICCNIQGDFRTVLQEILQQISVDRIVVEPSGVAKLSDLSIAIEDIVEIERKIVVVDIHKYKVYLKNFQSFFLDQLQNANMIVFSKVNDEHHEEDIKVMQEINKNAVIVCDRFENIDFSLLPIHLAQTLLSDSEKQRFYAKSFVLDHPLTFYEFDELMAKVFSKKYLRAKGNVLLEDNSWRHFEYEGNELVVTMEVLTEKSSFVIIDSSMIDDEK